MPGFNPNDTTSTLKGSLVPGSAKCTGGLDCSVTMSDSKLVTWSMGSVRNVSGAVEMVVEFPNAPTPVPFNSQGLYTGTLWNVGFLSWDQAISNVVDARIMGTYGRALAAACAPTTETREHCTLKSNEVVIRASLRKPPPGIVPCRINCLPNTGSAPYLLQFGLLGGFALVAGTVLVARRRRGEATG